MRLAVSVERYGDFELVRLIATGGMAEIYLAHQAGMAGFSRLVVVKRMLPELAVRPDFVTMFLDEARLAANLNHPNIVAVTNLGEVGSSYFIAMELVDGPHLGALFAHSLRLRKPLPLDLCCTIVARAADGLHYAHEQLDPSTGQPLALVHRDISPQNILVSRAGEVKVTDFGVAKASTHQTKTRTGIIKGKVAYMSPEQCLGEVVDRRTDVFALGIVLYELLTRRRLFREKSDLLIMQRITGTDVPAPSTINPEVDSKLDAICLKALARARDQRYSTAAELAEALDEWLIDKMTGDPRALLAAWFDENAGELAVSAGDVTGAELGPGPARNRPARANDENTSATPSLNSAETVMTRSGARVEPGKAPEPETTRPFIRHSVNNPVHAAHSAAEATDDEPPTVIDPDAVKVARAIIAGGAAKQLADSVPEATPEASSQTLSMPVVTPAEPDITAPPRSAPPARAPLWAAVLVLTLVAIGLVFAMRAPPATIAATIAADAGALAAGAQDEGATNHADSAAKGGDALLVDGGAPRAAANEGLETVTVETVPPGAALFDENNAFLHNAPWTFTHAPGAFRISAQFADQRITEDVVLRAGAPATVRIVAKVRLKVNVTNVRATVRVDGRSKGETPLELPAFLEPGRPVKLQLVASGYEPRELELTPRAGETLEVTESLRKKTSGGGAPTPTPEPTFGRLHVRTLGVAITSGRLDGERLPELPFRDHRTRSGRRVLTLQNPAEKVSESFPVTVPADGEVLVIVEFEKKGDRWKAKKPTIR